MRSTGRFTFVDLFAGIGGFHLALSQLGGRCLLASEIDPKCQMVYRRNFPATQVVGDIRSLSHSPSDVPEHDVLVAGFPCQPFSKSGAQLGLRDQTRGTLFFEIMEVVRARHPQFILLENVRNIAGPRHRSTWDTVVASLRGEGYDVSAEPLVLSPHALSPSDGGAPQVRERIFISAALRATASATSNSPMETPLRTTPGWSPADWRVESVLDDDDAITNVERYRLRPDEFRWLNAWNDFVQRLPKESLPGFPIWVDAFRVRPDTRSVLPSWRASFNKKNSDLYRANKPWIDDWMSYWHVSDFPESRRKFEWQARGADPNLWKLIIHLRPSGIRVRPPTYVPALVAITQTSIIGSRARRITPREAARLQGFPDTFHLHPEDAVAYRQLGNAVNVGVARFAAASLLKPLAVPVTEQLRLVS